MKFIFTVLSGIIVGIVGLYFSLDWKEEKLIYTLTEPATFGAITFQNIEIRNEGFDPATNVKLYMPKKTLDSKQIQFVAKFDLRGDGQTLVGGLERIRRGERALVSLTSQSGSVTSDDVSIKSDRSLATYALPNVWSFDTKSFWIGTGIGLLFLVFLSMGIAVPAYKDYQRKARAASLESKSMRSASQ
ncbi:MAG: hypothetical protein KJ850_01085 [Gammaproteobacteria bacterium]|nr:hypothetical protein [Gammaproteobacteria bacterium]MBU1623617.1 hypothetical protein [Gammaproteobacteria bacterium]